jgi:hypothetical protein
MSLYLNLKYYLQIVSLNLMINNYLDEIFLYAILNHLLYKLPGDIFVIPYY